MNEKYEIFNEVVKAYMGNISNDEYFDIDFDIFCDEFCVCHGTFDEVAEYIGKIIAEECKERLTIFDTILDNDVKEWAKDKYKEQFLTNECSLGINKKSIYDTAADFIDRKNLVEIRLYDEEKEEEISYVFNFDKAVFDVYHFLNCEPFFVYDDCIDQAKKLF